MRLLFLLLSGLATLPVYALSAEELAELDGLYLRRDEPEALAQLESRLQEGLQSHSGDYELLWRAAQLKYWAADGATDSRMKRQLAKEGWGLAEKAIEVDSGRVEGHYFAAISIGAYSQAVGVLKALGEGLEGKFNERLDKALSLDAGFDRGGPLMAKGRYHFELPWPKRSLSRSKVELEKCIKAHPESLRAHYYLAETLLADGVPKLAKVEVDLVLSGSTAYNPPEARRVQQWAKTLMGKIEEALK